MKKIIILIVVLVIIAVAGYFLMNRGEEVPEPVPAEDIEAPEVSEAEPVRDYEVVGTSVESREIRAYRVGEGEKSVVLVGALHGGYEWNTTLLSYQLLDYFKENQSEIPEDVSLVVIPSSNPDGLAGVVGTSTRFSAEDAPQFDYAEEVSLDDPVVAGRFNANGVDLNRNFDCNWKPEAVWRTNPTDAGSAPFSEPEARALRDFFLNEKPAAVVFYHSASDGVFASFCGGEVSTEGMALLEAYGDASGYPQHSSYPYYEVTGDAGDWLSTVGIPAIGVELSTHRVTEFDRNLAGVKAVFGLHSEE